MKGAMRMAGVFLTSLTLACGGSDGGSDSSEQASKTRVIPKPPSDNQAPEIQKVTISPRHPQADGQVTVEVEAVDRDGDRLSYAYRWEIDGNPMGRGRTTERVSGASKGDTLKVTAIVKDKDSETARSTSVKVGNAPPTLIVVLLQTPEEGTLKAVPRAKDVDGDPMTFTYQWSVNGVKKNVESDLLSLANLRMGDLVEVEVQANDGEDLSELMSSKAFAVGNVDPEITSNPHEDAVMDATSFHYQVKARDANKEQRLRYRIEEGPEGMEINGMFGDLEWTPSEEQSGEYPVIVVVDDRKGGTATQTFTVSAGGEAISEQE